MSSLDTMLSARRRPPLLNRVMRRVLRSPVSWLVDRAVMLVTVHGHRSGQAHTFDHQPAVVTEGLRRYTQRFPAAGRGLGVRASDPRSVTRVAADMAVVRIELDG